MTILNPLKNATFPILFTLFIIATLFITSRYSVSKQILRLQQQPKVCIIYDKPPSTFASTIALALSACMEKRNFGCFKYERISNRNLISKMLDERNRITSLVTRSLLFTRSSIDLIQNKCIHIIYISSTRTIRERLLSNLHNGKKINITEKVINDNKKQLIETEKYYEKYPNMYNNNVFKLKLLPNYVIRIHTYYFENDLKSLLDAFGCNDLNSDLNRFSYLSGDDNDINNFGNKTLLKTIKVTMKDKKFTTLSAIAQQQNNITLRLIQNVLS